MNAKFAQIVRIASSCSPARVVMVKKSWFVLMTVAVVGLLLAIYICVCNNDDSDAGSDRVKNTQSSKERIKLDGGSSNIPQHSKYDVERRKRGRLDAALECLRLAERERVADSSAAVTTMRATEELRKSLQIPPDVEKFSVNVRYLVVRRPTDHERETLINNFKNSLETSGFFSDDELAIKTSSTIEEQINYPNAYKLVIFNQAVLDGKPRGMPWINVYNGDSIMESNGSEGGRLSVGGFSGYETPKGGTRAGRETNMERYKHLFGY